MKKKFIWKNLFWYLIEDFVDGETLEKVIKKIDLKIDLNIQ